MTSDVTLTGALSSAQRTEQQSVQLAEDFDQFLRLLTTQLQNQDPLNPMDSTEFTNQLVQFSQVEQSINMNQKLDDLLSLELAGISSVALGYVGMDISYRSAELNYDGSSPVKINYALSEDTTGANLIIKNERGDTVFQTDVPGTAGGHEFIWNGENDFGGLSEEGTYSLRIDAKNREDEFLNVTTVVSGNVRGIESQDGVIFLLVGERAIALTNVINATEPKDGNSNQLTPNNGTQV